MPEKIGDAILELRTDTKKLLKGMEAARRTADKSQKQMETRAAKFSKVMKSAAGLGGIAVALAGVAKAFKLVFDTTQYAAQVRQTRMAFRSIAEDSGAMADDIIRNMRRMSGETISELDMMLSANRASLLGIPVDHFDDLMAIARASATATGESVGKMFDDIVKGIGRASPMILDNLGITVKIGEVNEDYAKSIGKTVEALTAQEKKQALLNAVLKSGEDIIRKVGEAGQILTDVERWQQTAAAAADFRAELGMNLLQSMGQIFEGSSKILRAWQDTLKTTRLVNIAMSESALQGNISELSERWKALGDQIKMLKPAAEGRMKMQGRTVKQTHEEIDALRTQQAEIAKILVAMKSDLASKKRAADAIEALTDKTEAWNLKIKETTEASEEDLQAWIEHNLVIDDIVAGLKTMTMAQIGLNGARGIFMDQLPETTEALEEQSNAQNKLVAATQDYNLSLDGINSTLLSNIGVLNEWKTTWDEVADEQIKKAEEAAKAILEAEEEILQQKKDQVAFIAGPFVDAYSDAFGALGEALVEGGNAWDAFREAFKESIAGLLDAIGKKLVIMALEALIPLPGLFNPVGAALAAAGAAASLAAAGAVRALAAGGDFITQGPEMIMVGDNPGGRERVSVTPVSSPNINGPGQMVHVTFNVGSRLLYDDFSRATANGEIIIAPRSIRK